MTTAVPIDAAVHEAAPESRGLTGLRGVAAMLVVMHHTSLHFGGGTDLPVVGGLLRKGYLGVDLFFVLSGFVMSMVYGGWFAADPLPARPHAGRRHVLAVAVFLVRRGARLWPLHAAVLAVAMAWLGLQGATLPSWRFALANVLMVQGWGLSGEINPPAWSASTELLAYLVFPLIAAPVLRSRLGALLGLAAVVCLLTACLQLAPPLGPGRRGMMDLYYNYSVLPPMRCLAGFLLGMVAWRAGRAARVRAVAHHPWVGPGLLLALVGVLLGWGNDLLALALMPALVLAMHYGQGRAWGVLSSGPLHWLGTLSYAIYLIHYLPLAALSAQPGSTAVVLVLYAAATLVLAVFAHRVVEQPTRRFIRWLGEDALLRAVRPAMRWLLRQGWGWHWS